MPWVLIERGEVLAAAGYVAASVLLCIGGLVAGCTRRAPCLPEGPARCSPARPETSA